MMIDPQHVLAGATLGASGMMFALQIVDDAGNPSIGVQGALLTGMGAMLWWFDRREQVRVKEHNAERREADVRKDAELDALRAEVRRLNERLFDELKRGPNGQV
jgi:hypothetical protein